MANGVVFDSDPHCVSVGKYFALQHADCVLLLGARSNRPKCFKKLFRESAMDLNMSLIYDVSHNIATI